MSLNFVVTEKATCSDDEADVHDVGSHYVSDCH